MSSSTTNDIGTPPTKKVRTQGPRREAEFKLGDVVVAAVYGNPLFEVTAVEYDQGVGAWKYKGCLWDSDIEVCAPGEVLEKPKYRPDQPVSFKHKGKNFDGKIVSVCAGIEYQIARTNIFNIAEEAVAARDG